MNWDCFKHGGFMRGLFAWLVLSGLVVSSGGLLADSFELEKDGVQYTCQTSNDYANACWEKCPYGFSYCHDKCGGGVECLKKCPQGFSSCANKCNDNTMAFKIDCWKKCDYSFSSCVNMCGPGSECLKKCPYTFSTCHNYCNE